MWYKKDQDIKRGTRKIRILSVVQERSGYEVWYKKDQDIKCGTRKIRILSVVQERSGY